MLRHSPVDTLHSRDSKVGAPYYVLIGAVGICYKNQSAFLSLGS